MPDRGQVGLGCCLHLADPWDHTFLRYGGGYRVAHLSLVHLMIPYVVKVV
jgi:hypothetical protein